MKRQKNAINCKIEGKNTNGAILPEKIMSMICFKLCGPELFPNQKQVKPTTNCKALDNIKAKISDIINNKILQMESGKIIYWLKNIEIRFDSLILGNYDFGQSLLGNDGFLGFDLDTLNYYSFALISHLNIGLGLSFIDLSFELNYFSNDSKDSFKETTKTLDLSYLFYWETLNLSFLLGYSYPFENTLNVSTDSEWQYDKNLYDMTGNGYFVNIGYRLKNILIFISKKEIHNSTEMVKTHPDSFYNSWYGPRLITYRTYSKINTVGIGYSF